MAVNSELDKMIESKLTMETKTNQKPLIWSYKPTGPLNLGHIIPLLSLVSTLRKSQNIKIIFDDSLNIKNDILVKRIALVKNILLNFFKEMDCNLELVSFVNTSEIRDKEEYVMDFFKLVSVTTESQAMETITNAADNLKLYNLIEPVLFINDIKHVANESVVIGKNKESICKLSKTILNDIHEKELTFFLHPILRDSKGNVMSKRNKLTAINIVETDKTISKKLRKYFCEEGNVETVVLDIFEFIIYPFYELTNQKLVMDDPHADYIEYKNIEELREKFANKYIHPSELKQECERGILRIVDYFFDRDNETLKTFNSIFN